MIPRVGERIGPYVLLSELGRGGMGVVYRARDERLGIDVALKTITAHGGAEAQRFVREARRAAQVQHPNVVSTRDVGEHLGAPYLVQDLVPGGALDARLRQGALPWREVCRLGAQVARGLGAIHAAGLVHRDLKPANVLLDAEGNARIADFGLARRVEGESIALTTDGQMVGTPSYMAPEQADGSAVEARADLYSLGATLFALLTARPPFEQSGVALLKAILSDAPAAPRSLVPGIPREVERLVLALLAKSPDARPGSAIEVARALDALARGPEAGAGGRAGLRVVGALSVVVALSVAGALAWSATSRPVAGEGQAPVPSDARTERPPERPPAAPRALAEAGPPIGGAAWRGGHGATSIAVLSRLVVVTDHRHALAFDRASGALVAARSPRDPPLAVGALDGERVLIAERTALGAWAPGSDTWSAVARLPGPIANLAAAPGGAFAAACTARADAWVVVRDAPGTPGGCRVLAQASPAWRVAISADGRVVAAGDADGQVRVWSGDATRALPVGGRVTALALSSDGARLLAARNDGELSLWPTAGGDALARATPWANAGAQGLALSQDGRRACSTSNDLNPAAYRPLGAPPVARLWDVSQGGLRLVAELPHAFAPLTCAFDASSKVAVTAGYDGAVRGWDAETGAPAWGPAGHASWIAAIAVHGERVVSAGWDGQVLGWDLSTGAPAWSRRQGEGRAHSVSIGGERCVTGGSEGTFRAWSLARGEPIDAASGKVPFEEWWVFATFADDGRRVVACSGYTGQSVLVQSDAGLPTSLPITPPDPVRSCAASGRRALLGMASGAVLALDTATLDAPLEEVFAARPDLEGNHRAVVAIAADARGARGVAGLGGGQAWLLDLAGRDPARPVGRSHGAWLRAVAITAAGDRAASCGDDCCVRLWDARTAELLGERSLDPARDGLPVSLTFAGPDDRLLLVGTSLGAILRMEAGSNRSSR